MFIAKYRKWLFIAALIFAVAAFRAYKPGKTVTAITPVRSSVTELVIASGKLRALRQSDIGSEINGIVEQVFVDDGDYVTRGMTLVTLSRRDLEQQVKQAELAVETAKRNLDVVRRGPLSQEIERARAELRQAQRVNSARVEAAKQRLSRMEKGGRTEELERSEAALSEARALREQAETDFRRAESLYAEGAISAADLDKARTAFDRAKAAERLADRNLQLVRKPVSDEEIAAARAELKAAKAALEESVRIARESLDFLLAQPREEDIKLAQSRLGEAEAAAEQARRQFAKSSITSPKNGIVVRRSVELGQSVNPGTPLISIADMSRTEIYVETDENNLAKLKVGQKAILISPAYSDQPFEATVTQIGPEVDNARGVVGVRLKPKSVPRFARPDMTVDVNIKTGKFVNVLTVPITAIIETNGKSFVLTIENGKAVRKSVKVLGKSFEIAAIEGISEKTKVIANATSVKAGEKVRARKVR